MTGARRLLAHALLAVHLVVFVLSGAVVPASAGVQHLSRPAASALASSSDGSVVVSTSDTGLERSRPRTDGGERGAGSPDLAFVVPRSELGIAPASLTGSLAIVIAAADHRPLPSVVHGPRGPPHA